MRRIILRLPFRYLGADDHAGPNYTGQPAVNSYYSHTAIEVAGATDSTMPRGLT